MAGEGRRPGRIGVGSVIVCLGLAWPGAALAFDILGLFGLGEKPPAVSQQTLPYELTVEVEPDDLSQSLKDASQLYALRQDAPPDGQALARRAEADLAPLIDALWGAGYYDATVAIDVAGVPLQLQQSRVDAAAAAAERHRARTLVPVRIRATPGPLFTLRDIRITDARTRAPFPPEELPPRIVRIKPGDPARAADLRAAQAAIVDHFRDHSHPLAKIASITPVVDHARKIMDVAIVVDPGPRAPFGDVTVSGQSNVDPAVVRSHVYIERGDPYSPKVLADTRKSVLQLPAISSVRIREPDRLAPDGTLPIVVEVADRKPRVVGFSAQYSTLDGPALRAYWQHRNLFGGAESLRLEGEVFVPPRVDSSFFDTVQNFSWSDLGGRFKASFVKPALQGTRNDLLIDALAEKDRTGGDQYGGYDSRRVLATAALRHRFSQTFSVQGGVAAEVGETSDSLGIVDYQLVGLPVSLTYDSTDRLLDPTKGIRVTAAATPYPSFLGSSINLFETIVRASAYHAVDDEARVILAGRVALGALVGPALADIPSNHRFYAGGGGSVRGYRYRSLSPLGPTGQVIGGRSLLEASFEARVKITDTIGLVPFFDVGGAFDSSYPDFDEPLRYAAGIGLRYYTAIGPIRLDAAVPLNPREGDQSFAVYLGIGQAF